MDEALLLRVWHEFWQQDVPYVLTLAVLVTLILLRVLPAERRRITNTFGFFALSVLGQLGAAFVGALGFTRSGNVAFEFMLFGAGLALINLLGLLLFRMLLPRLRIDLPRILEDVLVILAYVAWGMVRLRYSGVELGSLVTTSAIITAVLAFAMQDTLGNILGGLALQLDDSISLGDWIRIDDLSGKVVEIRWRYTAIETRNGELAVIPNSVMMKNKFFVQGRAENLRTPSRASTRRWIWFAVDYAVPPSRVIETVEAAFTAARIANVARSPAPSCVLMEFGNGYGRYALRFWLLDPQPDDPTDSAVRVHILATLQRAGMRIAVPENALHITKENERYRKAVRSRSFDRQLAALQEVELFASLEPTELAQLAERLVYAPFARGDVLIRQGETANWLYLLIKGDVDVWYEPEGEPRRFLKTLYGGSVVGEMGLLTGEARRATVSARTDVECYRLDKSVFEQVIRARPEVVEEIAVTLTAREQELESLKREVAKAPAAARSRANDDSLLRRIRRFFNVD